MKTGLPPNRSGGWIDSVNHLAQTERCPAIRTLASPSFRYPFMYSQHTHSHSPATQHTPFYSPSHPPPTPLHRCSSSSLHTCALICVPPSPPRPIPHTHSRSCSLPPSRARAHPLTLRPSLTPPSSPLTAPSPAQSPRCLHSCAAQPSTFTIHAMTKSNLPAIIYQELVCAELKSPNLYEMRQSFASLKASSAL